MSIADELVKKWPSAIVAGPEVKKFSGGIITGKTLQNLVAKGEEVPAAIRIGGKNAYMARPLAEWIASRKKGGKP